MEEKKISLMDPLFKPAIDSLEQAVNALFTLMFKDGNAEGKASLVLGIELNSTEAIDESGEPGRGFTPKIKFKAKFGTSKSANISGESQDDSKILAYHEDTNTWSITQAEKAQRSLF